MQRFQISQLERLPSHKREVSINSLVIDYDSNTVTLLVTLYHKLDEIEDSYIPPKQYQLSAGMDNYVDGQGMPVQVIRVDGEPLPEGVMPEFVFLDALVGQALMPIIQGAIQKADLMGRFA